MKTLAILTGLILAAIPASAQPSRGDTYRASGTEPFWSLTIDARTMRLEQPGVRPVVTRTPRAINGFAGEIYRTPQLNVNVVHAPCSDGMSDRVYRDKVTVTAGRRTLQGCGGDVRGGDGSGGGAPSRLTNTNWIVDTVNGRRVQAERPLTVNFGPDRVEGRLCNAFGGPYTMRGTRLSVGPVISTQMACLGPVMGTERTIFAMWHQPVRATVSRWGTLVLEAGRDTVTLRPARR